MGMSQWEAFHMETNPGVYVPIVELLKVKLMKSHYGISSKGLNMGHYIKTMRGLIKRQRGYGQDGFELAITIQFDAKEFNRIKKKQNPLEAAMAQIKNVVLDAVSVRGTPSYQRVSYSNAWPRASKGVVELTVYFEMSDYQANKFIDPKEYNPVRSIDLQATLEATRNKSHLFAKSVIASHMGN